MNQKFVQFAEAASKVSGIPGLMPLLFPDTIPQNALGGRVNGPSIVGERGPELFAPEIPGSIITNETLNRLIGSLSGLSTSTINNSSSVRDNRVNIRNLQISNPVVDQGNSFAAQIQERARKSRRA